MRGHFERARALSGLAKSTLEELGRTLKLAALGQVSGRVELIAEAPAAAEAELRQSYETLEPIGEKGYLSTTAPRGRLGARAR
jgi:hypothetical protein